MQYATLPSLTLVVLQRAPIDAATVIKVIGAGAAGVLLVTAAGW